MLKLQKNWTKMVAANITYSALIGLLFCLAATPDAFVHPIYRGAASALFGILMVTTMIVIAKEDE